jgi:hypothetical protein
VDCGEEGDGCVEDVRVIRIRAVDLDWFMMYDSSGIWKGFFVRSFWGV